MTSVALIGGLISVMMGAALIAKEVQNRTLYLRLDESDLALAIRRGPLSSGFLAVLILNSLVMILIDPPP